MYVLGEILPTELPKFAWQNGGANLPRMLLAVAMQRINPDVAVLSSWALMASCIRINKPIRAWYQKSIPDFVFAVGQTVSRSMISYFRWGLLLLQSMQMLTQLLLLLLPSLERWLLSATRFSKPSDRKVGKPHRKNGATVWSSILYFVCARWRDAVVVALGAVLCCQQLLVIKITAYQLFVLLWFLYYEVWTVQ